MTTFKTGDLITIKNKFLTKEREFICRTPNGSTIYKKIPQNTYAQVKEVIVRQETLSKKRVIDIEYVLIGTSKIDFWATSEQLDLFDLKTHNMWIQI